MKFPLRFCLALGAALLFASAALSQKVSAQSCSAPPPGLVAWYAGEGNALDIQGGNNGTLQGGATFVLGRVEQGFNLDGTTAFVRVPGKDTLYPGSGSFSVEAWIKTSRTTGSEIVFAKYEGGGLQYGNSYYALFLRNGVLSGEIRDTDAGGPDHDGVHVVDGTKMLADNTFHHVVMLRDMTASVVRLYVDGTA